LTTFVAKVLKFIDPFYDSNYLLIPQKALHFEKILSKQKTITFENILE
jgi:hypothetical protein